MTISTDRFTGLPSASTAAQGSGSAASGGTTEAPYPASNYAWFVVICLMLAYAVALVDRQILALLVQPLRADLKLSDTQFSLLAGFAFVLFYSTMGLFFGRLADVKNRRNMIVIGMILWCLATAACGLARSFHELFVARMLVGVGEAVLSPAAYSMIADYFPKNRRSRAASVYSMAIPVGGGAALLFGGMAVAATTATGHVTVPFLGEVRSWQAAFFLVGLPGLAIAALMMFVREPVRRETTSGAPSLKDAFAFVGQRKAVLGLIILAFALNGLVTNSMGTWIPAGFIRNFGWTAARVAAAQGTVLLTFGTAGILAAGWWVSRKGVAANNTVVLTAARNAMMVMPVFGLLAGLAPTPELRLVGVAGIAFFGGFPSALAPVAIYHTTPNQFRGQVTAMYLMTGTLMGFGVGVTTVAMLTDFVFRNDQAVGTSLGLTVAVATVIASGLLHLALKRPDKDFE